MMWRDWDVIVLWDGEKQMILEKNAVVDADIETNCIILFNWNILFGI